MDTPRRISPEKNHPAMGERFPYDYGNPYIPIIYDYNVVKTMHPWLGMVYST